LTFKTSGLPPEVFIRRMKTSFLRPVLGTVSRPIVDVPRKQSYAWLSWYVTSSRFMARCPSLLMWIASLIHLVGLSGSLSINIQRSPMRQPCLSPSSIVDENRFVVFCWGAARELTSGKGAVACLQINYVNYGMLLTYFDKVADEPCDPSQCCEVPYTMNGRIYYNCTYNLYISNDLGCFGNNRQWFTCRHPEAEGELSIQFVWLGNKINEQEARLSLG